MGRTTLLAAAAGALLATGSQAATSRQPLYK